MRLSLILLGLMLLSFSTMAETLFDCSLIPYSTDKGKLPKCACSTYHEWDGKVCRATCKTMPNADGAHDIHAHLCKCKQNYFWNGWTCQVACKLIDNSTGVNTGVFKCECKSGFKWDEAAKGCLKGKWAWLVCWFGYYWKNVEGFKPK